MKLRGVLPPVAETIEPTATLATAARTMVAAKVGSLGVLEAHELSGIITERDVMRAVAGDADPHTELVSGWMTRHPDVFALDVELREAAGWIVESGYRHLPVADGGELRGILSMRDVLAGLLEEYDELTGHMQA
jgi:CBS domain-containing protein